jgi:hypothetical protein
MPDMVHKYITPGLCEQDYKGRLKETELQQKIFQHLQQISPVKGMFRSLDAYINTLKTNLSYFPGKEDALDPKYQLAIRNMRYSGLIKF